MRMEQEGQELRKQVEDAMEQNGSMEYLRASVRAAVLAAAQGTEEEEAPVQPEHVQARKKVVSDPDGHTALSLVSELLDCLGLHRTRTVAEGEYAALSSCATRDEIAHSLGLAHADDGNRSDGASKRMPLLVHAVRTLTAQQRGFENADNAKGSTTLHQAVDDRSSSSDNQSSQQMNAEAEKHTGRGSITASSETYTACDGSEAGHRTPGGEKATRDTQQGEETAARTDRQNENALEDEVVDDEDLDDLAELEEPSVIDLEEEEEEDQEEQLAMLEDEAEQVERNIYNGERGAEEDEEEASDELDLSEHSGELDESEYDKVVHL